jgi:hypothetical protein
LRAERKENAHHTSWLWFMMRPFEEKYMPGMYFFNCNGPVQVGPFGNCDEARQDAENQFGGPCQFLGCTEPPCGCAAQLADPNWEPDDAFLEAAAKRKRGRPHVQSLNK